MIQVYAALLTNSFFPGFFSQMVKMYQGSLKGFCVPVLNCYSCPSALFSCPIGTLQHFIAHSGHHVSLYVLGLLGVVGSTVGRMTCGWICPFGLLQDVLYKVPFPKITLPGFLRYLKYAVLMVTVVLLPAFLVDSLGLKQPWFCKVICPAGTLEAGLPLLAMVSDLRALIGPLFAVKVSVLVVFLVLMVASKRPFCRTVCPLGAIYALFNRVSLYRLSVVRAKCKECEACHRVCPVDLRVYEDPNDGECIRCLECKKVCPTGAIASGFSDSPRQTEPSQQEV